MVRNFHFRILMILSIGAFVTGFIFLSSGLRHGSDRVGAPVGMLFTTVGLIASITAGAIRSIHRRLDRAGIADDPDHLTSDGHSTTRSAESKPRD